MGTVPQKKHYSIDQYLRMLDEESNETRYEYFDGEIFPVEGASRNHSKICANLMLESGNRLMDADCDVLDSSLNVWVNEQRSIVRPHVTIVCGKTEYLQNREDVILNPRVVIEVLSPSTRAFDRDGKFYRYLTIPSIKEYVLVEQKTPQVNVLVFKGFGQWEGKLYSGLEDDVKIPSLAISIPMKSIYRRVEFPTVK